MHLITVCNKRTLGLDLWEDTARAQGYAPTVLGIGDTRQLGHESVQFGLKFVLLAAHLQTLDPNALCLVTDGFDVVFHHCAELTSTLEQISEQLVFAGDVYENPDQGGAYVTKHLRVPYLNSGVYAGRARTILKVLEPALALPNPLDLDDQRYFTQYMFAHPGTIHIDHMCKVFVCMAGLEKRDYEIQEGRLVVFGQSRPSVIHFQGYYKDTSLVKLLYPDNPRIIALAQSLYRNPSACQRELGDAVKALGVQLPVPSQYAVRAGAVSIFIVLLLTLALFSRFCSIVGQYIGL